MTDPRNTVADTFRQAAAALERAARHCVIAAEHFEARRVPRGCAHAFAALGDMTRARQKIQDNAVTHAGFARLEPDAPQD